MPDDLFQFGGKILRQRFYCCSLVYLLAVDPLRLQPPFLNPRLHLKQVAAPVLLPGCFPLKLLPS